MPRDSGAASSAGGRDEDTDVDANGGDVALGLICGLRSWPHRIPPHCLVKSAKPCAGWSSHETHVPASRSLVLRRRALTRETGAASSMTTPCIALTGPVVLSAPVFAGPIAGRDKRSIAAGECFPHQALRGGPKDAITMLHGSFRPSDLFFRRPRRGGGFVRNDKPTLQEAAFRSGSGRSGSGAPLIRSFMPPEPGKAFEEPPEC